MPNRGCEMDVRRTKVQFDLGQVVFPFYRFVSGVNVSVLSRHSWGIHPSKALMGARISVVGVAPCLDVTIAGVDVGGGGGDFFI